MNKSEREDLSKLCRQRERVAKAAVDARAAEMQADFEKQLAAVYSYDDDAVWKEAHDSAKAAADEAMVAVSRRFKELGIPREFAPGLHVQWYGRGQNASKERRRELTKVAYTRIEAIAKRAKHRIESASVDIQTRLIASSLESNEAKAFLESMPTATDLMPLFTAEEILDPELRSGLEAILAQDGSALEHPAWEGHASLLRTHSLVADGTQFGPYKIEQRIGAGGMGEVFRAIDTRLGRAVALKTCREEFSERFQREARTIASLNHPHICSIYDVGPNYLVMELLDGESLAAN